MSDYDASKSNKVSIFWNPKTEFEAKKDGQPIYTNRKDKEGNPLPAEKQSVKENK